MLFSKTKRIIGIDIGTSFIKAVQVSKDAKNPLLIETVGLMQPAESLPVATAEDFPSTVGGYLKELVRGARCDVSADIVASLPNSLVFTSVVDMPAMSDSELASAVQFEAKKYVPLSYADIDVSWSVIGKEEKTNMTKVLLIAVPKQIKEAYVKSFEKAGLNLVALELEALSLLRCLSTDATRNSVIIDLGARTTGIHVTIKGILQLARNVNVGGDTMTEKLAQSLNLSLSRAEQFKRDYRSGKGDELPEPVKSVMAQIVTELRQIFSLYKTHNVPLDEIILVGGSAGLPGITEPFMEFGVTVRLGDPFTRFSYYSESVPFLKSSQLQLAVACGLAAREVNT